MRKQVEDKEDDGGADEQEYDKVSGYFGPVYSVGLFVGQAMVDPCLSLREDLLLPGGAAATEVPLIVAFADELSTFWAARQGILAGGGSLYAFPGGGAMNPLCTEPTDTG